MNCPQINLFYCTRTRRIICRLFINASVLLRFDHARVEVQLVLFPTGESKRGFQFAEVLNPLLLV